MHKIQFILGIILFCTFYLFSSEKIVTISTLYDYPPFTFKEEKDGNVINDTIPPGDDAVSLKGYSWDVVRESYHAVGYTVQLKITPWARGMMYMRQGVVDLIFPATKTDERLKKYCYSKHPTDSQHFVVYTKKDSKLKWNSLESLRGLHIGTMLGWSYGEKFDQADYIIKKEFTKINAMFNLLLIGRLDGVVGYEASYDYQLDEMGISTQLKKNSEFDFSNQFIIGLKENFNTQEKLKEFDRGMEIITKNGVLDKIKEKWNIR